MKGFPTLLLLLVLSVGCSGPTDITPEQQYKIAFIYQDNSGGMTVATVTPDGKNLKDVHQAGVIFSVKWSPNASKLAHDHYGVDLTVVNADGSNPTLLEIGPIGSTFSWSQDGTKIFFSVLDTIHSVEINTGTLKKITQGSYPAISPAGDEMAFVRDQSLYVSKPDGSNETMISGNYVRDPVWAPNGKNIAYLDVASGLWVIARTGEGNRRIVEPGNLHSTASWSPDASRLTYASENGIFVINADGSESLKIATTGYTPQWSPDGTCITYNDWPDGLMIVKPDGTGRRQLTSPKPGFQPTWSPVPVQSTVETYDPY